MIAWRKWSRTRRRWSLYKKQAETEKGKVGRISGRWALLQPFGRMSQAPTVRKKWYSIPKYRKSQQINEIRSDTDRSPYKHGRFDSWKKGHVELYNGIESTPYGGKKNICACMRFLTIFMSMHVICTHELSLCIFTSSLSINLLVKTFDTITFSGTVSSS